GPARPEQHDGRWRQDQSQNANSPLPGGDAPVQQHRADKGSAKQMQVERGQDQPPARRVDPGTASKAIAQQGEQNGRNQNPGLRAEQFEINQAAPADRRGKQKSDLGFGKRERRALVRHQPRQQNQRQQEQRAQ